MTFLILFLLIYGSANVYLGIRNLAWLNTFLPVSPWLYWPLLFLIAALPILSRLAARSGLPGVKSLAAIGDWWLAVTCWSVLLWLVADIVRLAGQHGFLPSIVKQFSAQGLAVNSILAILLLYGFWNALQPSLVRYEIDIGKQAGNLSSLRAVMVADIHAGHIVGVDRVRKLADTINTLQPDIVFYAGDLIDDDTACVAEENSLSPLREVRPSLGSYAVFGNHEYIGAHPAEAQRLMEEAGITVLRDKLLLINDAFYVAGRDDLSLPRWHGGKERQPLPQLLAGINPSLPVILLDHQPPRTDDPAPSGIDLQLSGHTHRGQFFPNQLLTGLMYKQDWGYWREEAFQLIVSCGYGTWGPPVRIGNRPELVEITIRFQK